MDGTRPCLFPRRQSGSQCVVALRPRRQTIQQRPQIKTSPPHHYRKFSPLCDVVQNRPAASCEIACRENLVGIRNVNQMVRNTAAVVFRQFSGPNIEEAIDLN